MIIGKPSNSTINFKFQSKQKFRVHYQNHFAVLPDNKTVIGVIYYNNQYKTIVSEDISKGNPLVLATLSCGVGSVLYDAAAGNLFASDGSGQIRQYQVRQNGASLGLVKNYGNAGIGSVYSSRLANGLAIFGGSKKAIIAIDIQNQRLFEGYIITAFSTIYSLGVCRVSKSKTLLSVSGASPGYSDICTYIFEMHAKREKSVSTSGESDSVFGKMEHFSFKNSGRAMDSLICNLQKYIAGLFRDFAQGYLDRLQKLEARLLSGKVLEATSSESELAQKVKKIYEDFHTDTKGRI